VIVWPVFIPGTLQTSSASAVLQRLAPQLWPRSQWQTPQPLTATAVRAAGRAGDQMGVAVFSWVPTPRGNAGYFYVTAAPASRYRQAEGTFAGVLQSFRAVGGPMPPGTGELTYVRWQDPKENAFSLEVPRQWVVSGGLFRFASVDVRPAIDVVSPDSRVRILAGDAQIPPFTVPNQMLQSLGFREGAWYSPGYGVNMMVMRYRPGVDFAKEYVMSRISQRCAGITVANARDLPQAAQAIDAIYQQYGGMGMTMQLTTGDVAFTCRLNDTQLRGYVLAGTQLTSAYGSSLWTVQYLHGYLAVADRAEQAQSVLDHMLQSLQLNPQWVSMQQNLTGQTSQIVTRTNAEISGIISKSYWTTQTTMDELSRRRSNATLGVEDVIDPTTGRQIKVESGSNYYWIDQRGTIVGTNTDTRPNLDFRELVRLP
jgi:hypothetical protein